MNVLDEKNYIAFTITREGQDYVFAAQNAYLVSAYPSELSDDVITGTKVFTHDKTQYSVLDIPRIYDYLGLSYQNTY